MIFKRDGFTEAEQDYLDYRHGCGVSGFADAIFSAIEKADAANLERITLGFPEWVAAYLAYRHGDLYTRWRAALVKERWAA